MILLQNVKISYEKTIQSILTPNQGVETIKQSKLGMCPTATVEEMVNGFFGDPSWERFVLDDEVLVRS